MQELRTYNHSKDREPTDRVSIFYTAAKISVLGPILCAVLLRGAAYGLKDMHQAAPILIVGGLATVVINVICFALGLFALFGLLRYRTQGVLVRAVLGLLFSGLSLGMFGAGFVRGFQAALKQHQFTARARSTPDQSGVDSGNGNAGDSPDANSTDKTDASTESGNPKSAHGNSRSTKAGPVDNSLAGQALANFQAQQQTLMTAFDVAALAIKTPPVLSMNDVTNREQLVARKQLVTKFLDANEKWLGFSTKGEVTFREEMIRLHATPSTVDAGLKEYREATADEEFSMMRVRGVDQRIGTATLNMLTVLEANWGGWKYNAQKNVLSFSDSAVAAQYNDSLADLNDAKAEQARIEAETPHSAQSASAPAKPSL